MANDAQEILKDGALFYLKAIGGGIIVIVAAKLIEFGANLVVGFL